MVLVLSALDHCVSISVSCSPVVSWWIISGQNSFRNSILGARHPWVHFSGIYISSVTNLLENYLGEFSRDAEFLEKIVLGRLCTE